jgi:hypothetical protein
MCGDPGTAIWDSVEHSTFRPSWLKDFFLEHDPT